LRDEGENSFSHSAHLKERGSIAPVIVITGHGGAPLTVEAKFGAVDFIEKPFDDEVMPSVVSAVLRRRFN
jgi:two-component system response regulator FixJ